MKDLQKVWILKGLPASGKSTWAKEYIKEHQDTKRVCRDDLRHMSNGYILSNKNENLITDFEYRLIQDILTSGYNLIVDKTHLNPKAEKHMIEYIRKLADEHRLKLEIEVKYFEVELEEAIKRDKMREFPVGEKVIKRMYYDYIYKEEYKPLAFETGLPSAIIVDIDGTIAFKGERNAYNFSKVYEDKPKYDVILLIQIMKRANPDYRIIIFSGRDDSCLADTERWLKEKTGLQYDEIHMRKTGDKRKDSIVKKELYEEFVKGKYNVLCVFDDRKQVIDMWRNELNLLCLDVAGHNI
jgi:predicted kinase